MVKIRWRKHASFLVMLGILTGTFLPVGAYVLVNAMPYLNLLPLMDDPSGLGLAGMEIVEVNFDNVTIENEVSLSNYRIDVDHSIWDINGIYVEDEYLSDDKTNYFDPTTLINDKQIFLTTPPLPNHTHTNENMESSYFYRSIYSIEQSEDDAWTNNAGTDYTSNDLLLGGHHNAGNANQKRVCLRWNITIPENASIRAAYIELTVKDTSTSPLFNGFTASLQAFDSQSTPPFNNTAENIQASRLKTPAIAWAPSVVLSSSYYQNNTIQFPLQNLVQNFIDHENYTDDSIFGGYIIPTAGIPNPQVGELIEFWSYDAGNSTFYPKLIIDWEESPGLTYSQKLDSSPRQAVETPLNVVQVIGAWNTSDHSYGNLYNESRGDYFDGTTITFVSPITVNKTSLWITYVTDLIDVVVEYSIKKWTSMIWRLDLLVKNTLSSSLTFPAANLSLNYLEDLLGNGWISQDTVIGPGQSGTVEINLEMKNTPTVQAFVESMMLGLPLELAAAFDAYILIDGLINDPFLGIVFGTELEFPFPSGGGGTPPFIGSINRSTLSANNDVVITVNASDISGTGISTHNYVYYSTDNGNSWDQVQMTGGTWSNWYSGVQFPTYFPFKSTQQEETYMGVIPGSNMTAGTEVLWYVYFEDYAGNIDHLKPGNWIVSDEYSFTVPNTGDLPSEFVDFEQELGIDFFSVFMSYLESYGVSLGAYMFNNGLDALTLLGKFGPMCDFFYENDIDSNHAIGMLLLDMGLGMGIMADSGVSAGFLLNLFGMNFEDLLEHITTHIFRPTSDDIYEIALQTFQEIVVIDDFDGDIMNQWNVSAGGYVNEELTNRFSLNSEIIGTKSLNWTTSALENLARNFSSNPISLQEDGILSFYIDTDNHTRLNGNMVISLIDANSREMTSNPINFEATSYGTWQEILLSLNSTDFTIEPGFDLNSIEGINFTYSRSEEVSIYLDYMCSYSPDTYGWHQYFTDTLQIQNWLIDWFMNSIFQGSGYLVSALGTIYDCQITDWNILPTGEISVNKSRTPFWNFLDLCGTATPINSHLTGANWILELWGVPDPYERLVSILGAGELIGPDPPKVAQEIYQYTFSLSLMMGYVPLALISYKVIKKEIIKRRTLNGKIAKPTMEKKRR